MIYALDIETKFAPAKISSIGTLLKIVLPLTMTGAALIFLTMTLYGAFRYLTSGDNPEALKKAQSTIMFAIIGLFIVIVSFVIVQVIGKLLNINQFI